MLMRWLFTYWFSFSTLCALLAQPWLPLPPNDRLSFRHSDSILITQELQVVEKKGLPNGDAVCDTCSSEAFLRHQGQMLHKQMLTRSNGDILLQGLHLYLLKPAAPIGMAWLFDTLNNRSAMVSGIVAGAILGQSDSIKTITLSDGKQILLSRSYGLVSWPDLEKTGTFELVGIKTRALGAWTPDWQDFYDFSAGDIFQYTGDYTQDPGTANTAYTHTQLTILDKWTDGDTLYYLTDRRSKVQYAGPFQSFIHDTFIQKFHPALITPWSESWPNQLWHLPKLNSSQGADSLFAVCRLSISPLFGLSKVLGGSPAAPSGGIPCQVMFPDFNEDPDLMICDGCVEYIDQVSVGLGVTRHRYGCFEYFENRALSAFVKDGDTTGMLYPATFFTSATHQPDGQFPVEILPNPTTDVWYIETEASPDGRQIVLSDIQGRMLQRISLPSGEVQMKIPAERLPGGVYLLSISDGRRQLAIRRLIKL